MTSWLEQRLSCRAGEGEWGRFAPSAPSARGPSGGHGLQVRRGAEQCPACGGNAGAEGPWETEITGMPGERRRAGPRPSVGFVSRQPDAAAARHSRCCVRRRRAALGQVLGTVLSRGMQHAGISREAAMALTTHVETLTLTLLPQGKKKKKRQKQCQLEPCSNPPLIYA